MSVIKNTFEIGKRAINFEDLKGSYGLTGPASLKLPENDRPELMILIFATDEENILSSSSITQAAENETVIQWDGFNDVSRPLIAVEYMQQIVIKHKP